jgi:hypothetical protein
MQTLKKDFATYIRNFGLNNVKLYGPQGDEFECKLQLRNSEKKSTKIGEGWKNFIKENHFNSGCVLNFKFVNKENNNVMKVVKI